MNQDQDLERALAASLLDEAARNAEGTDHRATDDEDAAALDRAIQASEAARRTADEDEAEYQRAIQASLVVPPPPLIQTLSNDIRVAMANSLSYSRAEQILNAAGPLPAGRLRNCLEMQKGSGRDNDNDNYNSDDNIMFYIYRWLIGRSGTQARGFDGESSRRQLQHPLPLSSDECGHSRHARRLHYHRSGQ
jgi:hypothetical protein